VGRVADHMEASITNNGSYLTPRERIYPFLNPGAMNSQEGLYFCWETDPAVARRGLPQSGGEAGIRIARFEGAEADALIAYLFRRSLGPLHDHRRSSALRAVLSKRGDTYERERQILRRPGRRRHGCLDRNRAGAQQETAGIRR
jgi:hypothetical protein